MTFINDTKHKINTSILKIIGNITLTITTTISINAQLLINPLVL